MSYRRIEKRMSWDAQIVLWINGHYAEWLDQVMWVISRANTWIALYVLLVGLIVYRYRNWRSVLFILIGFGIAVGLSDYTCSGILKPLVCRPRPTHEPALEGMLHLVNGYTGGLYGFCSSHAANTMAAAVLFSLIWRNKIVTASLMTWVTLIAYSRIYVGVHYPSDIVTGWLIGALFAVAAYWALRCCLHSLRADDEAVPPGDS